MAFFLDQPKSYDNGGEGRTFKDGVKFSYFKTDDKRPITFRLLPAFEEHPAGTPVDQLPNGRLNYMPAVTMQGAHPVLSDWLFRLKMSRSYIKGSQPVVSRLTLVERNSDGTFVQQDDPLSRVIEFCRQNKGDWGYLIEDQGKWGDPNRVLAKLPRISDQYLMNVVTYDDDRPGPKLAVISSYPAIADLCGGSEGSEGYAIRQTQREVSEDEYRRNPSSIFEYGDITDPNGAPVFRFIKTQDGKTSYHVKTTVETDPSTGRQRIRRDPVSAEDMAARVDLAHPETYINIPTPEEQVKQIVRICSGRNANGMHESEMLRCAINEYASLIPAVATPAAIPVQGFTPQTAPATTVAPVSQPAFQPAATQHFRPATVAAPVAAPAAQAAPAAPVTQPSFQPAHSAPAMNAVKAAAGFTPANAAPTAAPAPRRRRGGGLRPGQLGREVGVREWLKGSSSLTPPPEGP